MESLAHLKVSKTGVDFAYLVKEDHVDILLFLLTYARTLWLLNENSATALRQFCIRSIDRVCNSEEKIQIISERHNLDSNIKYTLYWDSDNSYILKSKNFLQPDTLNLTNSIKHFLQEIALTWEKSKLKLLKTIIDNLDFGYLMIFNNPVNKSVFISIYPDDNIIVGNTKDSAKITKSNFQKILGVKI